MSVDLLIVQCAVHGQVGPLGASVSCGQCYDALRRDALRYRWLRNHGAWDTEAFLNSVTPEEYDQALDHRMAQDP